MSWVVDSCVLLDIALKDPVHGVSSALFLESRRGDGLVACPVAMVEIAPFFGGEIVNVRAFLGLMGADANASWMEADTEAAAAGWSRYVNLRREGKADRRPIADILIGAFACRHQGLITRNAQHFRPYFPSLILQEPRVKSRKHSTAS